MSPKHKYASFREKFSAKLGVITFLLLALTISLFADKTTISFISAFESTFRNYSAALALTLEWIPFIIPLLSLFYIYRSKTSRVFANTVNIMLPVLVAFLISQLVHLLYKHDRPFAALGVSPLVPHSTDRSFPSDHAVIEFALSASLFKLRRKVGVFAFIIATISGLLAIIALLHWPSDIMGGALLGILFAYAVPYFILAVTGWIAPRGWKLWLAGSDHFKLLMVLLRIIAASGIILRFYGLQDNFITRNLAETVSTYFSNWNLLLSILCMYGLYVLATSAIILFSPMPHGHTQARPKWFPFSSDVSTIIWNIVYIDYALYLFFYVLTGHIESDLFYLFVVPIVTVTIFRDVTATLATLAYSVFSFGLSIILLYAAGAIHSVPASDESLKQWLTINIFVPRSFLLCLCSVPILWMTRKYQQLGQEHSRYESLVAYVPSMITRKNLAGIITYANDNFCRLNNLSRSDIVGFDDRKLYGELVGSRYLAEDRRVIESKEPMKIDERHTPHGKLDAIHVEGRKVPVFDAFGNVVEIQVVFWDVTERKQKEAQLEALMETTNDHIYFKDLKSRFLRISHAQSIRFGLDHPEQAIGKCDHDFFGKSHADKALQDELNIINGIPVPPDQEEEEEWPDGSKSWVSTTKQCLWDASGNLMGTFGISRDITTRKANQMNLEKLNSDLRATQEELKKAKDRLNLQLDRASQIAHIGVWEWDIYAGDGVKVKASDELYRIFGLQPQQRGIKLRDIKKLIHTDDLHIWDSNLSMTALNRPFEPFHIRLCLGDGTTKHLYAKSGIASTDANDSPTAMIGVVYDITDQKRLEAIQERLALAVRGFYHMIPGMADELQAGIDRLHVQENGTDKMLKARCFIFTIIHKAQEVRSLYHNESHFTPYRLGDIWQHAWPIALDLKVLSTKGLSILYSTGASSETIVEGAFYTAAVNILSNARRYGTPPFIVWCYLDGDNIQCVFGDGGPNNRPISEPADRGVGLPLSAKVLALANGGLQQLGQDEFRSSFSNAPQELFPCQTLFHVIIPTKLIP